MSALRRHPLITFFVLTFVISWGFLPVEAIRFLPSGPLIAALIVAALTQGWAAVPWKPDDPLAPEVVLIRPG